MPPEPPLIRNKRWSLPGCCYPLFFCILLPFLSLLTIPIYNWRAERAYTTHLEALKSIGETIRIEDLKPPEPGDRKQSFPRDSLIQTLFEESATRSSKELNLDLVIDRLSVRAIPDVKLPSKRKPKVRYFGSKDLPEFEQPSDDTQKARQILSYCKTVSTHLDEFAVAVKKPVGRFDLEYEKGFAMMIPQIEPLIRVNEFITIKSKSSLILGDAEAAANDVEILIRLSDQMSNEPALIFQLVRLTFLESAIGCIQEGLQRSAWSLENLERFEDLIHDNDVADGFLRAYRMERAMFVHMMFKIREDPELLFEFVPSKQQESPAGKAVASLFLSTFSGWYYDNARLYSEIIQSEILGDPARNPEEPLHVNGSVEKALKKEISTPIGKFRYLLAALALPSYEGVAHRYTRSGTHLDHVRIAMALERIRIQSGSYPDSMPRFTNGSATLNQTDPVTGEPYQYQLIEDGNYLLYGVGLNRTDDGGLWKKDLDAGDWVWQIHLPDAFEYGDYVN